MAVKIHLPNKIEVSEWDSIISLISIICLYLHLIDNKGPQSESLFYQLGAYCNSKYDEQLQDQHNQVNNAIDQMK